VLNLINAFALVAALGNMMFIGNGDTAACTPLKGAKL
jgi:hypothetical protein